MAFTASVAPASALFERVSEALRQSSAPELAGLAGDELHSLAALVCCLNQADAGLRQRFQALRSREGLIALAAAQSIPLVPSVLERFERVARQRFAQQSELTDAQLAGVSAGSTTTGSAFGLGINWLGDLSLSLGRITF